MIIWSQMDIIHNFSFSSKLMNGPNKLEGYIALFWKGKEGQTL
jgi:hypothetical protein